VRNTIHQRQGIRKFKDKVFYLSIALNAIVLFWIRDYSLTSPFSTRNQPATTKAQCPVPLPTIFAKEPPSANHAALRLARKSFDKSLARFYLENKLDSLAVAVVTSAGSIYESFHGPLRANESLAVDKRQVDRHSIYRIASISKMFACLETLILRNRGALNL
jgi:CubicO group peptidase (beta-lactamase class C family)